MSLNQDFQPPRHFGQAKRRQLKGQKIVIFCSLCLIVFVTLFFLSSETTPDLEARETPIEVVSPVVTPDLRSQSVMSLKITFLLGHPLPHSWVTISVLRKYISSMRRAERSFPSRKLPQDNLTI